MSSVSKRKRECARAKIKSAGDHKEFLKRITKTLYYGQLPSLPCLSLPTTELSCELWSVAQRGRSLRRLHADAAAQIARSACVSPCALVLAILYLERLNACNPDYLAATAPADLFLISLMVSNKFLQDDGGEDEVVCAEWAASGGFSPDHLKRLEIEFLDAINWNVFVSEKSFETGLSWLERQVALRQAKLRGFFTYTDLANTCQHANLANALKYASSAWLALAFSYVTGLMAVVTSTLVVAHTWLPALQHLSQLTPTSDARVVASNEVMNTTFLYPPTPNYSRNATETYVYSDAVDVPLDEHVTALPFQCCYKWIQYKARVSKKVDWHDGLINNEEKTCYATWWSRTSIFNWLYQISSINVLQRWLQKLNKTSELVNLELLQHLQSMTVKDSCAQNTENIYGLPQRCIRQWVNFSKLSALVISVTDR